MATRPPGSPTPSNARSLCTLTADSTLRLSVIATPNRQSRHVYKASRHCCVIAPSSHLFAPRAELSSSPADRGLPLADSCSTLFATWQCTPTRIQPPTSIRRHARLGQAEQNLSSGNAHAAGVATKACARRIRSGPNLPSRSRLQSPNVRVRRSPLAMDGPTPLVLRCLGTVCKPRRTGDMAGTVARPDDRLL